MIPAEAVEAAAKARYELGFGSWEAAHPDTREVEMEDMRLALEAAAPHMLAKALEEGDEGWDSNRVAIGANPFRPTP